MKPLKTVTRIDKQVVRRPAINHPDLNHWFALWAVKKVAQKNQCGVCWRDGDKYKLELHHRHYDNFGAELPDDVILLCESCHHAITNVIRARRLAKGDQSVKNFDSAEKPRKLARPKAKQVKVPAITPERKIVRSRKPKARKGK